MYIGLEYDLLREKQTEYIEVDLRRGLFTEVFGGKLRRVSQITLIGARL